MAPNVLGNGAQASPKGNSGRYIYVGTYTAPHTAPGGTEASKAKGIYVYRIDPGSGDLTPIKVIEAENPSFLALDPTMSYLYCVNELGSDDAGTPLGRVSAYRVDQSSGKLTFLNSRSTKGSWPCHCSVHPSGKYLFAANYGTGDFAVYPTLQDGGIGELSGLYRTSITSTGADPVRQEGPHAHMILTNPGGQHVFGVDMGSDQILIWDFDLDTGKLTPNTVPFATVPSGAGCRHMAFDPKDRFAYVLNELSSTIDTFRFDAARGAFIWTHSISTVPEDGPFERPAFDPSNPGNVPAGTNTTAEIRIHPTGRWLYATNRGMDSVAMFEVDSEKGILSSIGWVSSHGAIPRGMNLDPSGTFMYVGNQNSDLIAVFKVEARSGKLQGPIHTVDSPVPVDFAFGPEIKAP
ncbi:lactonase family protein [Pseudomonas sp. Marseille-QA0892]